MIPSPTSLPIGPIIAMLIGVVGSSVIHLSKGVMRLGMTRVLDKQSGGKAIYITGMVMNFTNPFWVMIANRFAPTIYYTSIYGVGLIALLIFTRVVLGERLNSTQQFGVLIVGIATLAIGVSNLVQPTPSLFTADRTLVIGVAIAWVLIGPIALLGTRRTTVLMQGLFFGLIGGGLAALDAILKGIAQSGASGNTFLPQTPANWIIFAVSFLGAAGAFVIIQWSYVRGCRAAVMGSAYDVSYVTLPLFLTMVAVPGARIGIVPSAGLFLLAVGVYLIQSTRPTAAVLGTG